MITDKQAQSFHRKYLVQRNGCWEWTAAQEPRGYGRIGVSGQKIMLAHRFSWELYNGTIKRGLLVCHKCDNPKCVNPAHLFLGTYKENHLDSVEKRRNSKPPIHFGEKHHKAKLTVRDVKAIRKIYASGGVSQRSLARQFNISQTVIMKVVTNKLWRHV